MPSGGGENESPADIEAYWHKRFVWVSTMQQTTYRGKTVTYDDVLRAMEHFDSELRPSFPHWRTYAVEHDSKLYPPKQLLRLSTGLDDIGGGGKPVNSRFEELGFTVAYTDEDA
jgi:hypothetical protein